MNQEDSENLRHVREGVEKIVKIMEKPKKLIARILDGVAMGVGILSVLSAIDVIKQWLGG